MRWRLVVACCVGLGVSSAVLAQGSPPAARTAEYDALFKRVFADPSNLEANVRFAELATRLGDYEAAIGALERMLFFNPNLPRVKLQLGVLYFKLGSYQMARSYLEQARAMPGAPADVQAEAGQFLAEIDRRLSPHKSSVFAQIGLRYQTNANAGASGLVRVLGQDAVINNNFAKRSDWNWFGLVGVNYIHDLQHGNEDALEASLVAYYAKQFELTNFDLGVIELQAGPRFSLPWLPGTSLKFYAIAAAASLARSPYFTAPGAGASMRFNVANLGRVEPSIEYRHRVFQDSGAWPIASRQTGGLTAAAITTDGALFGRLPWFSRVAYDYNETDNPAFQYNTYTRWSGDIGFPIPFSLPWPDGSRAFVLTPTAGASTTGYERANPTVDPRVTRRDREWRTGVMLDAQIYGNFGMRTQVLYSRTSSNLPNFDIDNLSVIFGPTARF